MLYEALVMLHLMQIRMEAIFWLLDNTSGSRDKQRIPFRKFSYFCKSLGKIKIGMDSH